MNLKTVKQFCQDNPAFTKGGLRWQIFNEDTYGLVALGVVIRMGRKILVDEDKYFEWVTSQNSTGLFHDRIKKTIDVKKRKN